MKKSIKNSKPSLKRFVEDSYHPSRICDKKKVDIQMQNEVSLKNGVLNYAVFSS